MPMDKYGADRKKLLEDELKGLEDAISEMEKIAVDAPILQRKRDVEEQLKSIKAETE